MHGSQIDLPPGMAPKWAHFRGIFSKAHPLHCRGHERCSDVEKISIGLARTLVPTL